MELSERPEVLRFPKRTWTPLGTALRPRLLVPRGEEGVN